MDNTIAVGKGNVGLIALAAFFYLLLLIMVLGGYQLHLVILIGSIVGLWFAYRFPLGTVVALLITGVIPTIFQMTPIFDENYGWVGGGLNAVDIVLVAMVGAVALGYRRTRKVRDSLFGVYRLGVLLGLWFLYEILRNVREYGLSAPGEFRYRFLILVIPFYIGLFFHSPEERRKLFKLLVFSAVALTLISIPFIGILKGWRFTAFGTVEARFLPSHITLGLVYGLMILYLAARHHYIRMSSNALWAISIPVLFFDLIDSHRSVWLVSIIILVSLVWLKEIHITKVWRWGIPVALIVLIVWFTATEAGLDVVNYISTRGVAFVDPEQDQTSSWRLLQWETHIAKFLNSPVTGEGFGAHFGLSGFKGDVGISPHSMYVTTLVKVGLVGMLLYLTIMVRLFLSFKRWVERQKLQGNPEVALVLAAAVTVLAAHAYFLAYSFDYYSLLFIGLGMSVLRGNRDSAK